MLKVNKHGGSEDPDLDIWPVSEEHVAALCSSEAVAMDLRGPGGEANSSSR